MDIKTGVGWSFIIIAFTLAFCLAVRPLLMKKPLEIVAESELMYAGVDAEEKEDWYWVLKAEVKDWVGILSPVFPVVLMGGGLWLKNKKKRKGNGNNR